jgi:DNA end-binding protein Ku
MRSYWSGDIVFGLVVIPVKMYTAIRDQTPGFVQLHGGCGGRVGHKNWCSKCNGEVAYADLAKGHEKSKGEFVIFTKEELKALEGDPNEAGAIEILQFIDPSEVDVAFYSQSTWIGPGGKNPKSARGYELLRHLLTKTGKVALVKIKVRTKSRLAILRPKGNHFELDMMRYAEEFVPNDLEAVQIKPITEKEETLGLQMMEGLTGAFDPSKHVNEYRVALQNAIEQKDATETVVVEGKKVEVDTSDLSALLMKSLEAKKAA